MTAKQARILITVLFGCAFVYLAWGFFVPMVLGAAIALLLHPLFDYLVERKTWPAAWAAALLTFGVTVLLILPATLLSIRGVRFAVGKIGQWRDSSSAYGPGADLSLVETIMRIPGLALLLDRVAELLHMESSEVLGSAVDVLKTGGIKLANLLGNALSSLPAFGLGVFLSVLAIYFFLADGSRVIRFFRTTSVFSEEQTEEIFIRFKELCRAVLLASLVSGLVQSFIYLVGAAVAGVSNLVVVGFSVFLASFIPVVGASPLTFGMAAYLFATGDRFAGFTLLVAALVASLADNFVRPMVLRGGANLHPLIAILALFGGLQVFGFAGVFIGPILAGMFFVFIEAHLKTRDS
jgi:predicted PurR-regulated permease PerM